MSAEDVFCYGLILGVSMIVTALIVLFIVSPIAERMSKHPNETEDFCLSMSFGLVVVAFCCLASLPK